VRAVLLRCPKSNYFLASDWINFSFRELVERRKWSWLIKNAQFTFSNQVTAGKVTVTNGSSTVVGTGTAFTSAMIGLQFRVSLLTPIYDIIAVTDGLHLTLDQTWGGTSQSQVGYQIYLARPIPPTDFHSFTTIYDPNFNWQLWLTVTQPELNTYDAQRSTQGTPYVCADYDYTSLAVGGATISPQLPRFEIWPHQTSQYVIPFQYESRPPDLSDATGQLPRYIPGDVLLEQALAQAARWPGPDKEHPNPYFNASLSAMHQKLWEEKVHRLEVQDDEVYGRDVQYGPIFTMPFAPLPFPVNAAYMQVHAI
jgi:hypothetical protein